MSPEPMNNPADKESDSESEDKADKTEVTVKLG
jgi:hypothetical protein